LGDNCDLIAKIQKNYIDIEFIFEKYLGNCLAVWEKSCIFVG
jgi:hypothetical protein